MQGEQFPLSMEAVRFLKAGVKHQKKERIKILVFGAIILLIVSYLGYQNIINTAFNTLEKSQKDNDLDRKNEALKTLNLWHALKGRNLQDMKLNDINLPNAKLSNANLWKAKLINADLRDADLSDANLTNAKLIDAKNLTNTQIKSACFWEKAKFKGHFDYKKDEWIVDKKANQTFINQVKQDKTSDPKTPPDCSIWR